MNNILSRFHLPNQDSGENSSTVMSFPLKMNSLTPQTPMKLPFKDATNKATNIQPKNTDSEIIKLQAILSKEDFNQKVDDIFDENDFKHALHQNCFCCGDERKTDAQAYFEELFKQPHVIEVMYSDCRIPEQESENEDEDRDLSLIEMPPTPAFTHDLHFLLADTNEFEENYQPIETSFVDIPDFPNLSVNSDTEW